MPYCDGHLRNRRVGPRAHRYAGGTGSRSCDALASVAVDRLGCDHDSMTSAADDLLEAPVGVALLDRLEMSERPLFRPFDALSDSDPAAVARAIAALETMPLGQLLHLALDAASSLAGPWTAGAPDSLAAAYALAPARRGLADALWQRFGALLVGSGELAGQEHWLTPPEAPHMRRREPAFGDFTRVYGNGEFTWSGVWTVSSPQCEIHDDLVFAWEMFGNPISRWRLPVRSGTRLWRIDRPTDWVRLVETFPRTATRPHAGWELPGPNQHRRDVARLAGTPGQHGVRTALDHHVLPDWTALSREYDGVHLSWAGFLTTEGYVSDLPGGGATMLRYWSSERTLWLRDVFGDPEPLDAPELSGQVDGVLGVDVRRDGVRADADRQSLDLLLNRSS
jgi:hypothetical protein